MCTEKMGKVYCAVCYRSFDVSLKSGSLILDPTVRGEIFFYKTWAVMGVTQRNAKYYFIVASKISGNDFKEVLKHMIL
jgi:hypothetical protein